MATGGAFLDGFVSILRAQNAAPSGTEKSLLSANVQGPLGPLFWRNRCADSLTPVADLRANTFYQRREWTRSRTRATFPMRPARLIAKSRQEGQFRQGNRVIIAKGANKIKGGGQALHGPNRRTGRRKHCYTCGSEYHPAPRPHGGIPPAAKKAPRPSCPSISMETPASM